MNTFNDRSDMLLAVAPPAGFLMEPGREGMFILKPGPAPLPDPHNGVYIDRPLYGNHYERVLFDGKLNVEHFGARLKYQYDDRADIQAAVEFAESLYSPSNQCGAHLFMKSGQTPRIEGGLKFKRPIRVEFLSTITHDATSGNAVTFHETAPTAYPGKWDVFFDGIGSKYATSAPQSINQNGPTGLRINKMIFSRFVCRELFGFSNRGLHLDGTGQQYAGQVVQHCDMWFGQIVNNGVGISAPSLDASSSSVQALRIFVQNLYQNYRNYEDTLATCSNTVRLNAMDNANEIGIYSNGRYNDFYVGFTGTPGTSLKLGPTSDFNSFRFANNTSTDIIINDNAATGSHDVVVCRAPNNLPATQASVVHYTVYKNNYGCPIEVSLVAKMPAGTRVTLSVGPRTGIIDNPAFGVSGATDVPLTFRVPTGGKWRVFSHGSGITYSSAVIREA